MANATFKALVVTPRELAIEAMQGILDRDPVYKIGWFVNYRYGYRFGANGKVGDNVAIAQRRLETPSRSAADTYLNHFIFDPDDTGKIVTIVQANWIEVRRARTDNDAYDQRRLLYYRKANVARLEREDSMSPAGGTKFLGPWARGIVRSANYVEINTPAGFANFIRFSPRMA